MNEYKRTCVYHTHSFMVLQESLSSCMILRDDCIKKAHCQKLRFRKANLDYSAETSHVTVFLDFRLAALKCGRQ